MLSSDLLRYKIDYKNNTIYPLLCKIGDTGNEYQIAKEIIEIFNECYLKKYNKEKLDNMIKLLEYSYKDYKLVRGLASLVEKKCSFKSLYDYDDAVNYNNISNSRVNTINLNSMEARRTIFQESANNDIAITKEKRAEIMRNIGDKINIDIGILEELMWSDLEENTIISNYYPIDPKSLLFYYNISLIQTLLFSCLRMEIRIKSSKSVGFLWKSLLKTIKKLGLMYWLEMDSTNTINDGKKNMICIIEGPLNILKLTEKYGNSMAKLVPFIIKATDWNIKADILRKSSNGSNVIYNFEISEKSFVNVISKKIKEYPNDSVNLRGNTKVQNENVTIFELLDEKLPNNKLYVDSISNIITYDSNIEKIFAQKFDLFNTGWSIEREPEPLITQSKTAFILDFILSKYQNKVLVEIIGFWTDEYLERKLQKILQVIENYDNDDFYMIIIINYENLAMFESNRKYSFSEIQNKNNILIVSYKNEYVSFKEIIPFLKKIETKYINQNFENNEYKDKVIREIDTVLNSFKIASNIDCISLDDINNSIELNSKEFSTSFNLKDVLENNLEIKDLFLDKMKQYKLILIGNMVFKEIFILDIYDELNNRKIDNLKEACSFFLTKKINDQLHMDLLKYMGFKIQWNGIDYSKSKITLNNENLDLIRKQF